MNAIKQGFNAVWQVLTHELDRLGIAEHSHEDDPSEVAHRIIISVVLATVVLLGAMWLHKLQFGNQIPVEQQWDTTDEGIEVSAIYIYPIKACKGIALQSVEVDEPGPLYDRRWVIVDKNGDFVTQRSIPRMAQIAPSLIVKDDTTGTTRTVDTNLLKRSTPTHLRLEWMVDGSYTETPILSQDSNPAPERKTITVWNDTVANAADQGDNVSEWLSATLEKEGLRLVYMDDSCIREITCKNYGPENEDAATKSTKKVAFPDATPLMLLSEESVGDLNSRLENKGEMTMPVDRFRPNILVKNVKYPFYEDCWSVASVGTLRVYGRARCTRCIVTTTDQETARQEGAKGEPLSTLREYRKSKGGKVCLGIRMVHQNPKLNRHPTVIRVADPVIVHRRDDIGPSIEQS